ncbi:MAG: methionine--tRNA ligase [Nitrososphaera sp.]
MSEPLAESSFVTFEEFSKVKFVMGKIISAESIPGMKKVLKATVDIGTEKRQIAVGVAQYYKPEEVVGRTVVVCANLEPKKIGGIISSGMLLSADGPEGRPIFLTASEDVVPGAQIR